MRHAATLVAAVEGIPRPAFLIARELAANSRSGLTVRFLAKKLELPAEEVEYLVDIHHNLFFHDLTKVKLVAEGYNAVKRITDGLENRGDVNALFNNVKSMSPHEFRVLEEMLDIDKAGPKKAAAEMLVEQWYAHPDSIVEYVATRGFSPMAQEIFDIVWNTPEGVAPASILRVGYEAAEYKVEEAVTELVQGGALFEMFRFDEQDRLIRVAGLLAEIRAWRSNNKHNPRAARALRPFKGDPDGIDARGLDFSDKLCRVVAAVAARPVRLRGDGDLFREDRRRLEEVVPEEAEPSLATCLWAAQGVGWLAQVDNELRAARLDDLVNAGRLERHRMVYDWLLRQSGESKTKRLLADLLDDFKAGAWYPVADTIHFALAAKARDEQPRLTQQGAQWTYVSPAASGSVQRGFMRALEETFHWLGVIDRADGDGDALFRVSDLGAALLLEQDAAIADQYDGLKAEIIVQPNFDIVVPAQEVDPLLTVPLDQFCERQSTGSAVVYHLSKDSFTKSIQDGHDGDAFIAYLMKHNRGGSLPPNVLQTLDDWRGSVKRVRIRTLHVIEADDPLVIADLVHRKRFAKYFAPVDGKKTVVIDKNERAELVKELEREGFVVG